MTSIEYIILFTSVIMSGSLFFVVNKSSRYFLKLSLAFTGSFLFAISVLHLMPDIYSGGDHSIGFYVLVGFFIQIVLEFFSEGIEHGHIHVHSSHGRTFPFTMMISLCLHSFLEGMPLSYSGEHGHDHSLFLGILLHHLPVAFALVSMLSDSGIKKMNSILWLSLFALMAPLGAITSEVLSESALSDISNYYDKIMAVVIGIFLHISTTILFESNNDHRFNLYKLGIIIVGGAFGCLLS